MPGDDYFLKIDGISGKRLDPKHTDEIEVISLGWGLTHQASHVGEEGRVPGGRSSGTFSFTMLVNEASPQLCLAIASGKHLKNAILNGSPLREGEV